MAVGGEVFTFQDFLADSIANFHLDQEEIEWSALAYVCWLPPHRVWTNKYGETFSFDRLATELIERPLTESVCAGSHLVQAMIVLARVDREHCPILSSRIRDKLKNRLTAIVRAAETAQAPDGSWGVDWHERPFNQQDGQTCSGGRESLSERLLATSHISEWIMLLPEELQVSDDRLRRAGHWLYKELRGLDSQAVLANFCPCTHGAIVLQMIRNGAAEVVVDRSGPAIPMSTTGRRSHETR
jgi:hypothetical protein